MLIKRVFFYFPLEQRVPWANHFYRIRHFNILSEVDATHDVARGLSPLHVQCIWKIPGKADGGAVLPDPAALSAFFLS